MEFQELELELLHFLQTSPLPRAMLVGGPRESGLSTQTGLSTGIEAVFTGQGPLAHPVCLQDGPKQPGSPAAVGF